MPTKKKRSKATSPNEQVTCPECGEKFWNTKALGGHRRWKHNVEGQSRRSRSRIMVLDTPAREEPQALLNAMEEMAAELQRLWALEAEYKRVIGLAQELSQVTARSLVKQAEKIAQSN